ncbi:MAG TPA: ATP synthase F1 subunit delta [Fimbriiglobus sp.]|nr:ATP synthase F1 subunit delta [Fimbriiglobus sp.]
MATQNGKRHDSVLEATGATARLARVYAEALMAAAGTQADAIGDDLDALVADVLTEHPDAERFLASGAVNRKTKAAVLQAAFGEGVSEVLRNFLGVLNQNNRLGLLRAIAAAYRKLHDEAAGRVRVRVASAVPLSDVQLGKLKKTLTNQLRAEPVLDARTDPDLLGGLVVQVGDRVYDSSVRTRLNSLRTHLLASGTYGSA